MVRKTADVTENLAQARTQELRLTFFEPPAPNGALATKIATYAEKVIYVFSMQCIVTLFRSGENSQTLHH